MDKLDRKLVANCPAPLPDPRYPKWEDTGGAKVIKGLNRRWEKILGWMPGEAGGQGGYFVDGHYAFKTTAPAKVVEKFAENFGEIPLDSAGVPFPLWSRLPAPEAQADVWGPRTRQPRPGVREGARKRVRRVIRRGKRTHLPTSDP